MQASDVSLPHGRPNRSFKVPRWIGCSVLCALLAAGVSRGAEQPGAAAQSSETKQRPPAVVAIADSEIISRAEQTLRSLQEMRSQVTADRTLSSIEKEFLALSETSDRRRESAAETMSKSRSVQRMNEILREWNLEERQLEDWDQALTQDSGRLAALEKKIDQIVATWRATEAAVAKKLFFKAMLERRVEDVLREAQSTRAVIQEQTRRLLNLQSQVVDRLANLAKMRKEIDEEREKAGRGLLVLDRAPLWDALFDAGALYTIATEISESPRRMLDDWNEFLEKYGTRISWHLALFVALLCSFHFLRQSSPSAPDQQLGSGARGLLFDRPFSSALLLALIPSVLLYPEAPNRILRTIMVPTVIPAVRLLPGFLAKRHHPWVPLLVALYLIEFLRSLLPEDWLLTRILLFLIAVTGFIGICVFLRSQASGFLATAFRERLMLFGVRLALVLFAVSALSNLVGNMTLAEFLTAALVRISYSATVVFAGAHLMAMLVSVVLSSRSAQWLRSVRMHGDLIGYRCRACIRFVAIISWLAFSLYVIGVHGEVSAAAGELFGLSWKLGAAEVSVRDVAVFFAVLFSAMILSRLLRFGLTEEILPRIRLPRGAPGAVDVLARYGVLLLGFFIALAAAGVDLSKVTLLISALGIGIGFGLQNVVNNFVSGLILVFEHPLQVGDSVEVGTISGEVRKIGFRASIIRTADGADVVVPNGELVGGRFTNWSLFDRLRRISISVGVAYGSDPNRVIEILTGLARENPAVLAEPPPTAVLDRLGESSLVCTLHCWSSVDDFSITRSELTVAIENALRQSGIKIPFPQQDIYLHRPTERVPADKPVRVSGGRE